MLNQPPKKMFVPSILKPYFDLCFRKLEMIAELSPLRDRQVLLLPEEAKKIKNHRLKEKTEFSVGLCLLVVHKCWFFVCFSKTPIYPPHLKFLFILFIMTSLNFFSSELSWDVVNGVLGLRLGLCLRRVHRRGPGGGLNRKSKQRLSLGLTTVRFIILYRYGVLQYTE